MIHRGEIVEKVVRQSGIPLAVVARRMNRSRGWIYDAFKSADLSLDLIIELGKVVHYDFSEDIPQITSYSSSVLSEPSMIYGENTIAYWKDKYYTLLEEHNALLKDNSKKK